MRTNSDWLPGSKAAMVEMANNWGAKFAVHGQAWGVPDAAAANLASKASALQTLIATPAADRTPTITAQITAAKKALDVAMRDVKKRYFFVPPMTDADLISLGLKPKDTIHSAVPAPSLPVDGDLHYPGAGLVEIRNIRSVGEHPDARADYGVRIYYGILGEPTDRDKFVISAPPRTGEDLPHSVFTRQKKHRFDFSGCNGREIYFCMRFENSKGQAGPWGAVLRTYVP